MDLQVIDIDSTTRRVYLTVKAKTVSGIYKLIQIVVLALLNTPGKDVLDPATGGGFLSLIGSNIDPDDSSSLYADISYRVSKVEDEIIASQVGLSDDKSEKLQELRLIDIKKGETDGEYLVRIKVINQEGRSSDITV
jgi:hypothetical protein